MAKKQISKMLHENLKVEVFKVKDSLTDFRISHKASSIVVDEDADLVYLLLKNSRPFDNIVSLYQKKSITVIGGDSSGSYGNMLKAIYDSNNNDIVDRAEGLTYNNETISAEDFIKHIKAIAGDIENPHNIDAKADITGNKDINFKVKEGQADFEATNFNQYQLLKNNASSDIANQGDFFLKGFWKPSNTEYPKPAMYADLKGWYWIVEETGAHSSDPSTVYQIGDYIVYNGLGDGSGFDSWYKKSMAVVSTGENPTYNPGVSDSEEILHSHGGIPEGTTAGELRDNTMSQMFDEILFPLQDPKVGVAKQVGISGSIPSKLEIGTTLSILLSSTFNQGTIINGNQTTNVNPLVGSSTNYALYFNDSVIVPTDIDGNFDDSQIMIEGNNSWKVRCDHNEGTGDYFDSRGNVSNVLDNDRLAGNTTSAPKTVSGRYSLFHGIMQAPESSAEVRYLDNTLLNTNRKTEGVNADPTVDGVDLIIQPTQQYPAFAVPSGSNVQVNYVESSNADVTGSFSSYAMQVEDAGGTLRNYQVYHASISGYGQVATYRIKIK